MSKPDYQLGDHVAVTPNHHPGATPVIAKVITRNDQPHLQQLDHNRVAIPLERAIKANHIRKLSEQEQA